MPEGYISEEFARFIDQQMLAQTGGDIDEDLLIGGSYDLPNVDFDDE